MEEAQPRQDSLSQIAIAYDIETGSEVGQPRSSHLRFQSKEIPPQIDDTILTLKRYESLFLEDYLPSDPRRGGNTLVIWVLETICVNDPGRALEYAKEALFLTRVGRMKNDSSIVSRGRSRYGHALRELQRALMNNRDVVKDETLSACQALTLYEVKFRFTV